MFEAIRHISSTGSITSVSYRAGEVIGHVSFHACEQRSCVISSIGPDEAVRECSASHYYGSFSRRQRARTGEAITDLS